VEEFLNSSEARVLTYYGDTLTSTLGLPKKVPRGTPKVVAFQKHKGGVVSGTPADDIVVSDMTPEPLEHLEKLLAEVYIPLLSNPSNQEGWGEVASKEIMDRLHGFLANVAITVGQTRGETCLPLPPLDASTAAHISAKDRIHLLEGAVITWTKQIKNVLKQDPESLLKAGLHPTPDVEIEFWKTKAGNLNAIFEQLQSERIRRVLQFLDMSKSTYCTPFAKLCKEVFAARLEANDNVKYLRTLESWFGRLNSADDFEKLPELFRPIMHILLLIWKNSKFYNTPARLVVIVREICNAIINQALKFVSGKNIFELIAEEQAPAAVAKLKTTLRVCGDLKRIYFNYKTTANAECPHNPWRIQNTALFLRLDAFLERCHDVLEMTQIIVQFSKLERIVIGGTKGKVLTATLEHIYVDFKAAVAAFEGVPYDIMEVERKEFDDDFYKFRNRIKELERRLGAVLTQAFDDCVNIYARFKLLDSFDTLLERPLIQDELERKHIHLVQMYAADLKKVQEIFLTERDAPPISWNLPPIAGALYWCRGLKERIVEPMAKIRQLNKDIMNREEAKEVMKVYTTIMSSLDDFEHQKVEEWGADVERSSQAKLKLPLLTRAREGGGPAGGSAGSAGVGAGGAGGGGGGAAGGGAAAGGAAAGGAAAGGGGGGGGEGDVEGQLLAVNFDPGLVRLLREVKYFLLLGLEVPSSALEIYKKAETFRRQTGNLDLLVGMYNQMVVEMLPVEAPLLKAQLQKIDATLVRGIKDLNWKSAAIDGFVGEAHALVKAAYDTLFQLKANLRDVVVEMEGWSREPLLQRKSKPMTPEEFEAMYKAARTQRYAAIQEGGKAIDRKLKESQAIMKVPKGSPHWAAYVDFVNGIVVQGLARLVVVSLRKLVDLLSPEKIRKAQELPMLVIDLTLAARLVRFTPDVVEDAPAGPSLYDTANGWVDSFYHAATMFKRLDDNEGKYVKEMVDDLEVQMLLATLNDSLARSEATCQEFRARYEAFSYLWTTDMGEAFAAFCEAAYVELPKSEEQAKAEADMEADEIPPQPRIPDLARFDAEIAKYRELGDTINALKTPTDLGWLRVNAGPIKQALSTVVSQWVHTFTAHLQQFVVRSVGEMHEFITAVVAGLDEEVSADSPKEALRRCMGHIRDVRKTRYIRKALIPPLRRAVTLLKKHGVHVDDTRVGGTATVSEYLEQADLKVEHCINRTFAKKEQIFPLQTAEMEKIKVRAVAFEDKVREFWNGFRKAAPFAFTGPPDGAYASLDAYFRQLVGLEDGARDLNEVEELFELPISKFNEMAQCRVQLRLLKVLWDFKAMVLATYDNWKTATWAAIQTEVLEDANKKLATELRKLGDGNQIVKGWAVFKDIDAMVRDMSTTLPLVNELHSPSMRARHWKELAHVCGVKALDPTDAKFSLEDMVDLKLHTHKEAVEEIVDAANKEQKIERKMDEIEAVWRTSTLDYLPHKDGDVRVPRASDEIMENLDAHQMELQSIVSMGKVMEFFRDRVEASQKSLGIVEEVLKEWLSVTKAWASLESIFLASADIRAQLPDDTKRFEGIDSAFKEVMKSAVETPNVVEACTKEGRGDVLKEMTKNLELCQKSLNEYLDTKKKIFPRFYFVSNVALLDILSNGNVPQKIMPYTGDCFDSITNLEFDKPAEEGVVANVATKMIAKDGEIVDFFKPFVMTGAVERWLNDLTVMQQDSLRFILEAAIETAVNWEVERPRHFWLEDYPAQVVLVGTQIYWTEETQASLDELEGGQEDAVKKYLGVCNDRLNALIMRVLDPDLKSDLRTKVISLITMDVHSRDVVQKLIDQKAEGQGSFVWSQQLRFYWAAETRDVNIAITDFRSKYFYEWVGNSGRLVITPLTDRCYITLTLALRLSLGGAPAGPAGTGKTETTKDLARALALPCYVFNCGPTMTYQTIGDIFKGLAQTGAWGCFDEFNRIDIEVLSVVATQVKAILDACVLYANPANRPVEAQSAPAGSPPVVVGTFELGGDVINLIPTVGLFITMNPGYAGRTELPENLKALFRSCAMIRPDLMLICENMLMSEGFQLARPLSVKFVTLYQLASELLSPQAHYDWGLRSVKSVLRVAGAPKRGGPAVGGGGGPRRARRGITTPTMPPARPPTLGPPLQDLFPKYYQLVTKFRADLQKLAIQAAKEAKPPLQHDHGFIAKVVQLQDIMDVRHSVMLVGPAGCGKSTVWKTLAASHNLGKPKNKAPCVYDLVDPKAVTGNELYGFMTLAKEWRDGVLSIIMRGMSKNYKELGYGPHQTHKWVVLDGDIDAIWIESMNTVMDDNKVLTLVSNERIPLSAAMRMVFEVHSLANATPATVSRAGILFINDTDIGWRPYVETWMTTLSDDVLKAHLPGLFDKYIDAVSEGMRRTMKTAVPLPLINQVMSVCRLMEGFLDAMPKEPRKPLVEVLEHYFFVAVMWSFGGALVTEVSEDGSARGNHRANFHALLTGVGASVKLPKEPEDALCFDYRFNPESEELEHWSARVPKYAPVTIGSGPGEVPFSSLVVPTVDSTRLTSLMHQLVHKGHPVMFVGNAGTGKTTLVKSYLATLDDAHVSTVITMNYYMDSAALQMRIDGAIDKRSGRLFGPPTGKRMLFYLDDLNLPYIETYGTQNSLSLLRQIMDHRSYFDRADLGFRKEVTDCFYLASMNPTAGSFTVTERLQRLHTTFACLMPSDSDLSMIYKSILVGFLRGFLPDVQRLADSLVDASIRLHKAVSIKFLPDAERFMYNWNMRELANVFQGLTSVRPEFFPQPLKLLRLWVHEAQRVFGDRLVDAADGATFTSELRAVAKLVWKEVDQEALFAGPVLFTSFAGQPSAEPTYLPLPTGPAGMDLLSKTLIDKLEDYNTSHSIMDLVLFEQAMEHVARICRIISNPGGNAMLIGVGGSGKQSLSRLSAHICGYEMRQLQVTSRFTVTDLKDSLKEMYRVSGVKGVGLVFLLTDSQIVNDKFLVYVNDILASGWISDLFERDELDAIYGSLRNEAKAAGVMADVQDEMLKFFISRVRSNLHLILCFSPVGATFRVRARRFPGLINCTVIDKFHAWPKEALVSVAARFIDDLDLATPAVKESVALHMAEVHTAVTVISDEFKEKMRRYNYVTPKSFLELIAFYRFLLAAKRGTSGKFIRRLDDGLARLAATAADVAELKIDVQRAMAKAEEEVKKTEELVGLMSRQAAEAEKEKEAASKVAERASAASAVAAKVEHDASKELAEAKPALERAQAAVRGLDKASLTELKNFNKPPKGVEKVTACCLMMMEGEFKNQDKWDRAKKMMADVGAFLSALEKYDARNMTEDLIARLEPYVSSEGFTEAEMRSKSAAAANLCSFVVNLYTFNRIYVKVKPLMDALERAQADRQEAQGQLDAANERVAKIEANLKRLEETLAEANAKKLAAEGDAARCSERLQLANRLVNGLASENERWGVEVARLRETETMLIGDVLLASAFVSYIGAFNNVYRRRLWADTWMVDLKARAIPLSEGSDPLAMLTDEGRTAKMMNEGLPADRVSVENGSIISGCKRWPLIIDPQLQGIKWLRKREEANRLVVVQLTQPSWLKAVVNAIQQGLPVIIENVGEEVDATLEPVLSRAVYNKGRTLYLRVGGEEVEYDAKFRLYLQTKLSNPHYRPEVQAQCTLINFIATESGLQDQLLARVVNEEKADLERRKQELQEAFNTYKMQLIALEDDLLSRLQNAPEDILSDVALIEGLEATKAAVVEINLAVARGKATELEINAARQVYVPVAEEGAMLYFLITALNSIEHMYQYSLDSFMLYFYKSIREAPKSDDLVTRVASLRETLRLVVFTWVNRGLFERHKLILMAQLTFQLMARGKLRDVEEFNYAAFQFLLRGPKKLSEALPAALDWLPEPSWFSLQALAELEGGEFAKLPADLSEAPTRFKEWFNHVTPESEKLPLDWSALDKTPFKKLLVLRCMRPDRLNVALRDLVAGTLPHGAKYVDCDATFNSTGILEDTLHDSTAATPIFFILSPGADVVADVDKLAVKHGYTKGLSYHNVSMGQGQDIVAMEKLDMGHKQGHWVLLNNVHLMPRWLVELEKKLDAFAAEGSQERFRVFLTAEPSPNIPMGVLNRSIKLTNEPPQGLKANLKRAFCSFSPEYINEIDTKMRAILFGLCHFHAVMIERKKFGAKGFNLMYPFSLGDLRDSAVCLQNYMENASGKIPWEDLRYIFGQIMYGGHIVNDFDRLLCVSYLEHFLRDELLDEMELFPFAKDEKGVSFKSPSPTTYDRYLEHIETEFKGDTPIAFGLHPNAEIGFRTEQSETLLRTLLELQPRDADAAGGDDKSPRALAGATMGEFQDAFGEVVFDVDEIQGGMEDVGPFQNVLILELKQMNALLSAIKRSLGVLKLGFDGRLTMSEEMEKLETELALDKVPGSWSKLAWPSLRPLSSWKHNLQKRVAQLTDWVSNPMEVPKVTWLSGLINPQSFLTAIRQQTAQRTGQELDKLVIQTEVTKRTVAEIDGPSRDGCYITGLYMQGARFDVASSTIDKSRPREMYCDMPVINCRSVGLDKLEEKGMYSCPVYKTEARANTYVFSASIRSKSPAARWVMAGVALIMDIPDR